MTTGFHIGHRYSINNYAHAYAEYSGKRRGMLIFRNVVGSHAWTLTKSGLLKITDDPIIRQIIKPA